MEKERFLGLSNFGASNYEKVIPLPRILAEWSGTSVGKCVDARGNQKAAEGCLNYFDIEEGQDTIRRYLDRSANHGAHFPKTERSPSRALLVTG